MTYSVVAGRLTEGSDYLTLKDAALELLKQQTNGWHITSAGETFPCKNPTTCKWISQHFYTESEALGYRTEFPTWRTGLRQNNSNRYVSRQELEVRDFLQRLNFEVVSNSKDVLPRSELDMYLPERKVAVEFNGDYWHSSRKIRKMYRMSAYDFHYGKFTQCANIGVTLAFVWEGDWRDKREEVIIALVRLFEEGELTSPLNIYSIVRKQRTRKQE